MWVNRAGRYPYITRDVWSTRVWLLIRKDPKSALATTRRVAAMLDVCTVHDGRGKPQGVVELLSKWMDQYDDSHEYPPSATPGAIGTEAEARMGS